MSWGSFITTLNTDKNRKSEKESAERHRVMHMEVPLLTSTAIASFHIHSEFISSWAIQVALPLLRRWIQRVSALPAIFLRSQWNCSAVAWRWIVPSASQAVLWLSLHQWASLHPGRALTQTDPRWENFPIPRLSSMFSFQHSKQACSDHWTLQNLLVNDIKHCNNTRLAYEGKTQLGLDGWWVLSSRYAN